MGRALCGWRELSIVRQKRLDDACILGGYCNDRPVIPATRPQGYRPARHAIRFLRGALQHRTSSQYQQRTQISVAAFCDAAQARLTAGRVLPRDQSQPCRKLPTIGKFVSVADAGGNGRGGKRPYAWQALNPYGCLTLPRQFDQLLLVVIDPFVEVGKVRAQI